MKTTLLFFALLCLFSGAAWGLHETLIHHWYLFAAKFPNADPQWWDASISWTNKGDGWFLRTVGAVFTDAKHMASTVHVWALVAGTLGLGRWIGFAEMVLHSKLHGIAERAPFWLEPTVFAAFFLFVVGFRALGFHLVYSIYFK